MNNTNTTRDEQSRLQAGRRGPPKGKRPLKCFLCRTRKQKCTYSRPEDACDLCLRLGENCLPKQFAREDKDKRDKEAERAEFYQKLYQFAEERLQMGQAEDYILALMNPDSETPSVAGIEAPLLDASMNPGHSISTEQTQWYSIPENENPFQPPTWPTNATAIGAFTDGDYTDGQYIDPQFQLSTPSNSFINATQTNWMNQYDYNNPANLQYNESVQNINSVSSSDSFGNSLPSNTYFDYQY